jgi:hypothetical protein
MCFRLTKKNVFSINQEKCVFDLAEYLDTRNVLSYALHTEAIKKPTFEQFGQIHQKCVVHVTFPFWHSKHIFWVVLECSRVPINVNHFAQITVQK